MVCLSGLCMYFFMINGVWSMVCLCVVVFMLMFGGIVVSLFIVFECCIGYLFGFFVSKLFCLLKS